MYNMEKKGALDMIKKTKYPTVTIRISQELLESVTALATKQDRSVAYIVRGIIQDWLHQEEWAKSQRALKEAESDSL